MKEETNKKIFEARFFVLFWTRELFTVDTVEVFLTHRRTQCFYFRKAHWKKNWDHGQNI